MRSKEARSKSKWLLDRLANGLFHVLHCLTLFGLLIDLTEPKEPTSKQEKWWDWARAIWVLIWLGVLIAIWLWNPDSSILKIIFGVLAGWRLLEVFTTGLGTALKEEQQVRARSLVTIAIYGVQLTLIFAILYHSFATTDFVVGPDAAKTDFAAGSGVDKMAAASAFDYLYISWSNITSLGNNIYVPADDAARFLEVATTTAGILLLGVLLAFGIDAVRDDDSCTDSGGHKASKSQ